MSSGPRRLTEEIRALADALEGAGDLADSVVQARLSCSSEAELVRVADSLGVEVQTQSGAGLAQRQFGPLRLVAFVDSSALYPREGPAMTMREVWLANRDEAAGDHWPGEARLCRHGNSVSAGQWGFPALRGIGGRHEMSSRQG